MTTHTLSWEIRCLQLQLKKSVWAWKVLVGATRDQAGIWRLQVCRHHKNSGRIVNRSWTCMHWRSSLCLGCPTWDLGQKPHLMDQVFTGFTFFNCSYFFNWLYNRKANKILIWIAGIGTTAINYICAPFQRQGDSALPTFSIRACFLIKTMAKQHPYHL